MPQVSKYPLNNRVKEEIVSSLWWILANLKTKSEIEIFMGDFLTRTEKTMLAKRLAIAMMLIKGYSYDLIKNTLKVSTSTIFTIRHWLDEGGSGYRLAVQKLLKHEEVDKFFKELVKDIGKSTIRYLGRNIRFS